MITIALIALLTLFVVDIVLVFGRAGFRHYWLFEMLHLFAGFFVMMLFVSFSWTSLPALAGLAFITLAWELAEYHLSPRIRRFRRYASTELHLRNIKPTTKDTVLDVILNFAGAAIYLLALS